MGCLSQILKQSSNCISISISTDATHMCHMGGKGESIDDGLIQDCAIPKYALSPSPDHLTAHLTEVFSASEHAS